MEAAYRPRAVPSARMPALVRAGLIAAAVGASAPWWAPAGRPEAFWIMAAMAVLADARPDPAHGRRAAAIVLPSVCFTFAIVLAWGLLPALAVQAAAVAVAAARQRHAARRTVHLLAQYAAGLAAAATVASVADLRGWSHDPPPRWSDAAVIVLAAVAWTAARFVVVAGTSRLIAPDTGLYRRHRVAHDLSLTGATLLLGAVLLAAAQTSAALVPLVLAPLMAVNRLSRALSEHRRAGRVDRLTGLLNRRALAAAVAGLGRNDTANPTGGALLLLDLNRFRDINDALGHVAGDQLLRTVAARLVEALPAHDAVARLGGDEFAVLAPRVFDAESARQLAGYITTVLAEPVRIGELPVDVSAAVGIALWPEHGADFAALLGHAETAMYDAKRRGDPVAVYPVGGGRSSDRLALLADLRETLRAAAAGGAAPCPDPAAVDDVPGPPAASTVDAGQITVYYQPQVAIASGEVVGVEALLRWRRPGHGVVDPAELIRVAEPTSVMRLLTEHVLGDVLAQVGRWRSTGWAVRTSVNVSIRDLDGGDFADRVDQLLRRHAVPPGLLQVEITEGALMVDARRVLTTVNRLNRIGVAISLDDFGTGYSSLQHLRRLPAAEVKIDRSFVLGMVANPDDAAIVRSLIHLADSLGLRVVAEGVEDDRTWRDLHAAGCHIAQGWFYARPMPADEFAEWLARYRPVRPAGIVLPGSVPGAGALLDRLPGPEEGASDGAVPPVSMKSN